jgi:F0F1-type ATP synthase membrane subunit b/b'
MSAQDPLYKALGEKISKLRESAEAYAAVMQAEANNEAYIKYQAKIAAGFEDSEANVKQYYRAIERGWGEWKEATELGTQSHDEIARRNIPRILYGC